MRIQGFPNYSITSGGTVLNMITGNVMKPYTSKRGYVSVRLSHKGKQTNKYIHRLVAIHFLENPEELPHVNHIDEDKSNNSLLNLEWCTDAYNKNHSAGTHSLINPDGALVTVKNLSLYCKVNGLHTGHMYSVANGSKISHKGWRLA